VAFSAGQKLTADLLNAAFDRRRRVYQTSDISVTNSATLVSSTDMVLSMEVSAIYSVDMYLITDGNSTGDAKYNLLVPTGALVVKHSRWGGTSSDTTVTAAPHRQSLDQGSMDLSGVAFGTRVASKPSAVIAMGSTAGSCTFQFAQNTANNTNPSMLLAGSWMELVKLSA